eukprot:TRINITY_DN1006_c0_g1_i2.p1 TRINITY_DN1006_c0_g1~~TRINITY_DN1006_c0_g1_i2.p1  ORF type:complete len:110 (+),score=32.58 TRINITY_DN1006_c0_g1_i2:261-590(+)
MSFLGFLASVDAFETTHANEDLLSLCHPFWSSHLVHDTSEMPSMTRRRRERHSMSVVLTSMHERVIQLRELMEDVKDIVRMVDADTHKLSRLQSMVKDFCQSLTMLEEQ